MQSWTIGILVVLGASACRPAEVERGETRTRSGELSGAADGGDGEELVRTREKPPDGAAPRDEAPAARDPRFDAGRLSIVGSAQERDSNLGLGRDPTPGAVDVTPPAPQQGAGAVEPAPAPTMREGAGRPGAAGDPYQ